jgi:hypothetical protein
MIKCQDCGNEHGVTVLATLKPERKKDPPVEIIYNAGIGTRDGRVLCWFCSFPTVGSHL